MIFRGQTVTLMLIVIDMSPSRASERLRRA